LANYICETQISGIQSFTGPSGQSYVSQKDQAFNVADKEDQKFFNDNPRFKKVGKRGAKKAAEAAAADNVDQEPHLDEFRGWLKNLNLKQKEIDTIVESFESLDNLRVEITGGTDLTQVLSKKLADKIYKAIEEGEEA
jgi:hypothetical protein